MTQSSIFIKSSESSQKVAPTTPFTTDITCEKPLNSDFDTVSKKLIDIYKKLHDGKLDNLVTQNKPKTKTKPKTSPTTRSVAITATDILPHNSTVTVTANR